MNKEFRSMKKDGDRDIKTFGIQLFGYQIWFQTKGMWAFCRACHMSQRICRKAERLNDQLLRLQKLVAEFNHTQ